VTYDQDVKNSGDSRKNGRRDDGPLLDRLRIRILSGDLCPGSVVSQVELARDLGVSTTPLREALRQLEAEGLLVIEQNRRPRVAPLDVTDLHAIYSGRILMESFAIRLTVPTLTAHDLVELEADLTEAHALGDSEDLESWEMAHDRYHRRLTRQIPAGLSSTLDIFYLRSGRYRRLAAVGGWPHGWGAAHVQHRRILEACRDSDPQRAAIEMASHLARTALILSATLAPESDPRPIREALAMVTGSVGSTAMAGEPV
jgi:DNA-binding GntR family transcriptional regulator